MKYMAASIYLSYWLTRILIKAYWAAVFVELIESFLEYTLLCALWKKFIEFFPPFLRNVWLHLLNLLNALNIVNWHLHIWFKSIIDLIFSLISIGTDLSFQFLYQSPMRIWNLLKTNIHFCIIHYLLLLIKITIIYSMDYTTPSLMHICDYTVPELMLHVKFKYL